MGNTILIGTFLSTEQVPRKAMREIFEHFEPGKLFVFEVDEEEKRRFLLTFNIRKEDRDENLRSFKEKFKNTIQLHRNKDSNTLYTINGLNAVVKEQNFGQQDDNYTVDWSGYRNSCVLAEKETGNPKKLPTILYDVVDL